MKIRIIAPGKIKEKYLSEGINEYKKRISRFSTVEIIELPDEKIPDNPSGSEIKKVLEKEGEKILKALGKDEYIVTLCIEGEQVTSIGLADKIQSITLSGKSTVTFVIGGSLGIDEKIKKLSNYKLSFSKLTFPNQLMIMILLEQIYRAFKINNNEDYHK